MGICVIGGKGRMGGFHVKRLREEHPKVKVHICDINDDWADSVAYIIATPSDTHYEIAKELIQAGKHVLVEKPVALHYHEAQILYRLAQEHDVVFMAGHTERFNPAFRKALPEAYFRFMEYHRYSTGRGWDLLFDTMIHDLELALYLNNITEIDADWLEIVVQELTKDTLTVWVNNLGQFNARYNQGFNKRKALGFGNIFQIDFLAADKEPIDSLQIEHAHFLKLCEANVANGHARYAVAAVGLAERISAEMTTKLTLAE